MKGSHPEVPWWNVHLGDTEIDAVSAAIRARHVNQGKLCRFFEERMANLLGTPCTVTSSSGSSALVLSLLAHEIGPGDEVILPAHTFIATAHAVQLVGARPVLADVQQDRPLLELAAVERSLNSRTRAVIPVHLNGAACDTGALIRRLRPRGIVVIEDAAQALMSRGPDGMLGTVGDAGAYSLSMTKLITTGEGGLVAFHDERLIESARAFRNQGTRQVSGNVFDRFGFNFRFTDLQAAMALVQIDVLDARVDRMKAVHSFYTRHLSDLPFLKVLPVHSERGEVPLYSQVLCSSRERVIRFLAEHAVETRAFHPSLSDSPHLASNGDFPNAERFSRLGLTLPSGPDQTTENLERTVSLLHDLNRQVDAPDGWDH